MRRREFLASTATAATLGPAAVARAAAQLPDEYALPEFVSATYDEEYLSEYRPWLNLSRLDVRPYGLFAQVYTSPEYSTDALVYAARYTHQDGVSSLAPPLTDSHWGDTEWVFVFVDDAGAVEEVAYTLHHWTIDRASGDEIPLYDETHPSATVVNPHHSYILASGVDGEYVTLRDLLTPAEDGEGLEYWLDRGMSDNLHPEVVKEPWTLKYTRDHLWRSGFDATYAQVFRTALEPLPFIGE